MRQTGRTTRMLMEALGTRNERFNYIVFPVHGMARNGYTRMREIIDKCNIPAYYRRHDLLIEIIGKTFYMFITEERFNDECYWKGIDPDTIGGFFFDHSYIGNTVPRCLKLQYVYENLDVTREI